MKQTPLVSVVVPTRNSAATLGNCLESIMLQTYSNIELIVVDNESTDGSKEIAARFTQSVQSHGPERSAQRNLGLKHLSHGSVLSYIDSDMILGPNVVFEAVAALSQGYVGVYVPEIILAPGFPGRVRRFERNAYDGTVIDAVRFFQAEAFLKTGGFDEVLFEEGSGEDWDLDIALAQTGDFVTLRRRNDAEAMHDWPLRSTCREKGFDPLDPSAIYHDESTFELSTYLKKKNYYAQGFGGYKAKWGANHPSVRKQFSLTYRLFGVFFSDGQWKRTLKSPHLYASTLVLRVLVAAGIVKQRFNNCLFTSQCGE